MSSTAITQSSGNSRSQEVRLAPALALKQYTQVLLILLVALGLKQSYSTANPNQLRWILTPTTVLVELVTGRQFSFESHAGYMSSDHTFLIAASCAGVNFLITAFVMLALMRWWNHRQSPSVSLISIPACLLVAYAVTLVANTVRISTALQLQHNPPQLSWTNPDELHRLEGIFIYFGFLLLLYVVAEKFVVNRSLQSAGRHSPTNSAGRHAYNLLVPLAIYYTTTLAVPFVNGAHRQGVEFWQHALFVFGTPLLLIIPIAAFRLIKTIALRRLA